MGPLRLLLDEGIASMLWRQSASAVASEASCPSCAKEMASVEAPGESGVVRLDLCRRCHMAWIDEGEWGMLPRRPRLPEGELPVRAREVLAEAEIDRVSVDTAPSAPWQRLVGLLGVPVRADGKGLVFAPLTWAVAILMIAATVAGYVFGLDAAVTKFGLVPAQPERVGGMTLITSFFLHGGVVHLLVNLYFLMIIGSAVEERVGSRRTAVMLAASVATAALAHMAFDPRPAVPLVGASGGIAGLFALFALAFSRVPFRIFVFILVPPVMRWVKVSAATLGLIYLGFNLVGLWYQLGGWSDVSSLAHLGGAAAGVIFWMVWRAEIKTAQRVASVTSVSTPASH